MSLTKIGSIGINTGISFAGVTTIATLNASDNVLSVGGTVNFVSDVSIGGTVSIAGTLTYEDVTNVDAVGLITAQNGIVVGSGITLSKDGDIFATGVMTATSFSGSGANLTGVSAGEFFGNSVGVSTSKNVGIHTTNVNTEKIVGAANSFVGLFMGDGFIGFPTSLNRSGGYFIATTVNALNAGPVSLGSDLTLHGTWTIV